MKTKLFNPIVFTFLTEIVKNNKKLIYFNLKHCFILNTIFLC